MIEEGNDEIRLLATTGLYLGNFSQIKDLRKDSLKIFDQVFKIFKKRNCDSMLLLGNIFHERNPNNATMILTMKFLKNHIFGEEKKNIKIGGKYKKKINFNKKNLKIQYPVFCIHGENDSPNILENSPSPLELLEQPELINYLGDKKKIEVKRENEERYVLNPVTIEKNNTKLALYFLGYTRETSLSKRLIKKQIDFSYPGEGFIKIFCINQEFDPKEKSENRPSLKIHPDMIPDIFDYVLWASPKFKKSEILNTQKKFKIIKISNAFFKNLNSGELRRRYLPILRFVGKSLFFEEEELTKLRPFILMKINSEIFNSTTNRMEIKSEQSIKDDIRRRLEIYYQSGNNGRILEKPILKVIVYKERNKYLKLKPIEESLHRLVVNEK